MSASGSSGATALPPAEWGPVHKDYNGKINGGAITAGCGAYNWATGNGTLPVQGKYRIEYRVNSIEEFAMSDIGVGVISRSGAGPLVREMSLSIAPKSCYYWFSYRGGWFSYRGGSGSQLYADGRLVQDGIRQESRAGSTIEVIVDQDASTVEFRLDGVSVADPRLMVVNPKDKQDLTPAACVKFPGSALTLVAVEAVAR